jgi:hypothetical protein
MTHILRILVVVAFLVALSLIIPLHSLPLFAQLSEGDQAIAAEKRVWEAEKAKDGAVLDASLGADYVEIAAGEGLQSRAAVIKELSTIELKEYSLTAMKARPVAPGVVLLTYHFHVIELHDGKPHPSDCTASSLWALRSGKWVNVIFQETPDS